VIRSRLRLGRALVALAACSALLLAACSDDEGSSSDDASSESGGSSDDSTPAEGEEASASETDQAFCEAVTAVDTATAEGGPEGEVDPAAVEEASAAIVENAPEDLTDQAALLVETIDANLEDPDHEPGEDFYAAYGEVQAFQVETCGYNEVEASAIDYAFQDLPTELEAGPAVVTLNNEGSEFHEVALLKVDDDYEGTLDELLALPEEEAFEVVGIKGIAFAPVGEAASTSAELDAGRYVAVCFLPVGSTPEAFAEGGPPDGPPHFTEGMVQEIQVS